MPWLDTFFSGIRLDLNINPGALPGQVYGPAGQAEGQHLDQIAQSIYGLHRLQGIVIHPGDPDYDPEDPEVRTRPRETDEQLRARIAYVASGPPLRVYYEPRYVLSDGDRLDAQSINRAFGRHVVNDGDPISAHVLNLALGFEAFSDGTGSTLRVSTGPSCGWSESNTPRWLQPSNVWAQSPSSSCRTRSLTSSSPSRG